MNWRDFCVFTRTRRTNCVPFSKTVFVFMPSLLCREANEVFRALLSLQWKERRAQVCFVKNTLKQCEKPVTFEATRVTHPFPATATEMSLHLRPCRRVWYYAAPFNSRWTTIYVTRAYKKREGKMLRITGKGDGFLQRRALSAEGLAFRFGAHMKADSIVIDGVLMRTYKRRLCAREKWHLPARGPQIAEERREAGEA